MAVDPINDLYNGLKKRNPDMPSFEQFKTDMAIEGNRKDLWTSLKSKNPDLPDFNQFSIDMGFEAQSALKKKEQTEVSLGDQGGATPSDVSGTQTQESQSSGEIPTVDVNPLSLAAMPQPELSDVDKQLQSLPTDKEIKQRDSISWQDKLSQLPTDLQVAARRGMESQPDKIVSNDITVSAPQFKAINNAALRIPQDILQDPKRLKSYMDVFSNRMATEADIDPRAVNQLLGQAITTNTQILDLNGELHKSQDPKDQAEILMKISDAHSSLGQYDEAMQALQAAKGLTSKVTEADRQQAIGQGIKIDEGYEDRVNAPINARIASLQYKMGTNPSEALWSASEGGAYNRPELSQVGGDQLTQPETKPVSKVAEGYVPWKQVAKDATDILLTPITTSFDLFKRGFRTLGNVQTLGVRGNIPVPYPNWENFAKIANGLMDLTMGALHYVPGAQYEMAAFDYGFKAAEGNKQIETLLNLPHVALEKYFDGKIPDSWKERSKLLSLAYQMALFGLVKKGSNALKGEQPDITKPELEAMMAKTEKMAESGNIKEELSKEIEQSRSLMEAHKPYEPATKPRVVKDLDAGIEVEFDGKKGTVGRNDATGAYEVRTEDGVTELPKDQPIEEAKIRVVTPVTPENLAKVQAASEASGVVEDNGSKFFVSTGGIDKAYRITPDGKYEAIFENHPDPEFAAAREMELVNKLREERGLPPKVEEIVSDEEYNTFVNKGEVSDQRIADISEKVKNNLPLSERETVIFTDKTGDVNKAIALGQQAVAQSEGVDNQMVTIDPAEIQRQMKPITDEMANIEAEFENKGYEIDWDYDNEIIITDKKTGDIVDPSELPTDLAEMGTAYEAATLKLGEYDHSSYHKALEASREAVKGKEVEYEDVTGQHPAAQISTPSGTETSGKVESIPEEVQSGDVTNPALKDVESTAKALEGRNYHSETNNDGDFERRLPLIYKGSEGKSTLGFYSPDRSEAKSYGTNIREAMINPNANILEIIDANGNLNEESIKEYESITKSKLPAEGVTESLWGETKEVSALRKAGYDGVKAFGIDGDVFVSLTDKATVDANPKSISEAYHEAKTNGTNPELVKEVEELLNKKEPEPLAPKQVAAPSNGGEAFTKAKEKPTSDKPVSQNQLNKERKANIIKGMEGASYSPEGNIASRIFNAIKKGVKFINANDLKYGVSFKKRLEAKEFESADYLIDKTNSQPNIDKIALSIQEDFPQYDTETIKQMIFDEVEKHFANTDKTYNLRRSRGMMIAENSLKEHIEAVEGKKNTGEMSWEEWEALSPEEQEDLINSHKEKVGEEDYNNLLDEINNMSEDDVISGIEDPYADEQQPISKEEVPTVSETEPVSTKEADVVKDFTAQAEKLNKAEGAPSEVAAAKSKAKKLKQAADIHEKAIEATKEVKGVARVSEALDNLKDLMGAVHDADQAALWKQLRDTLGEQRASMNPVDKLLEALPIMGKLMANYVEKGLQVTPEIIKHIGDIATGLIEEGVTTYGEVTKYLSDKMGVDMKPYEDHIKAKIAIEPLEFVAQKAKTAIEREKLGLLSEIDKDANKRGFDDAVAQAKYIMQNPDAAEARVQEILEQGKDAKINDVDVALLDLYALELKAKQRTLDVQFEAIENQKDVDPEMKRMQYDAVIAAQHNLDMKLNRVLDASDLKGSIWGRTGVAMQMALKEDYSSARLKQRVMAAKNGEPLTAEQSSKIEELSKKIEELSKKIESDRESHELELAKLRAEALVKAEGRRTQRATNKEKIRAQRKEIVDDIMKSIKEARKGMNANAPAELAAFAKHSTKLVQNYIKEGVVDLSQIVDDMHETFKDAIQGLTKDDIIHVLSGDYNEKRVQSVRAGESELARIKREAKDVWTEARKADKAYRESQEKLKKAEEDQKRFLQSINKQKADAAKRQAEAARKQEKVNAAKLEAEARKAYRESQEYKAKKKEEALNAQINKVRKQIDEIKNGTYVPPPIKPIVEDTPSMKVQRLQLDRLKNEAKSMVSDLRAKNAMDWRDYVNSWQRLSLLSGFSTIAKLGTTASLRVASNPIEAGLAYGLSYVPGISNIAHQSPRYGRTALLESEMSALKNTFNKATLEEMKNIWKTGVSSLDLQFGGKQVKIDKNWMEIMGRAHALIKYPAKVNEFYRSYERRFARELARNGYVDAATRHQIGVEAYNDAMRNIMMGDNFVNNAHERLLAWISKESENPNNNWYVQQTAKNAKFVIKSLLPITKVPVNYAKEAVSYTPAGLVSSVGETLFHLAKGELNNLPPEYADHLMKNYTKGTIGTLLALYAWNNPQNFGGYMTMKTKNKGHNDVPYGDIRINGYDIPHWYLHTPPFEVMQMFATARRIHDDDLSRGAVDVVNESTAALSGLGKSVPFWEQPARIMDVVRGYGDLKEYLGEYTANMAIPQGIQQIGQYIDPAESRKARNFGEAWQKTIPLLRERLPADIKTELNLPDKDFEELANKGAFDKVQPYAVRTIYVKSNGALEPHYMSDNEIEQLNKYRNEFASEHIKKYMDKLKHTDSQSASRAIRNIYKLSTIEAKNKLFGNGKWTGSSNYDNQ